MANKIVTRETSIGLCGILICFLAVAKAVGLEISWWWVFAPIWLPVAAVAALVVVVLIAVAAFMGLSIIVIAILEYFS